MIRSRRLCASERSAPALFSFFVFVFVFVSLPSPSAREAESPAREIARAAPAGVAFAGVACADAGGLLATAEPPPWWDETAVRLSPEVDADDFEAQLDFVAVAYSEKGRPRQAIRLLEGIAERAGGRDGRVRLRARYEIARLYEVFLRDAPRALAGYRECLGFPLREAGEARQNRIAAGFGCLRVVAAAGSAEAVPRYRLLVRDLVEDPDPYGTLLLPEVLLRLGDVLRHRRQAGEAERAYRAAVAAAEGLPQAAPFNYRAPLTAARVALRALSRKEIDFARVDDGTFEGLAFGYNAPVGVRLTFRGGRLEALHVTEFGDKRPLDAYRLLPRRVLEAQALQVDGITGATVTSRAMLDAAAGAIFEGDGP